MSTVKCTRFTENDSVRLGMMVNLHTQVHIHMHTIIPAIVEIEKCEKEDEVQ